MIGRRSIEYIDGDGIKLVSGPVILMSAQLHQTLLRSSSRFDQSFITCKILLEDHSPYKIVLLRRFSPNYFRHDIATVKHNVRRWDLEVIEPWNRSFIWKWFDERVLPEIDQICVLINWVLISMGLDVEKMVIQTFLCHFKKIVRCRTKTKFHKTFMIRWELNGAMNEGMIDPLHSRELSHQWQIPRDTVERWCSWHIFLRFHDLDCRSTHHHRFHIFLLKQWNDRFDRLVTSKRSNHCSSEHSDRHNSIQHRHNSREHWTLEERIKG